jgi:hypothetical protein
VRQPIVLILLLIAFFTTISGKPLDGFLMLTGAILLIWDATRSRLGGQVNSAGALASLSVAAAAAPSVTAASASRLQDEQRDRIMECRGLAAAGAALEQRQ